MLSLIIGVVVVLMLIATVIALCALIAGARADAILADLNK